jgi:hypothetical protein
MYAESSKMDAEENSCNFSFNGISSSDIKSYENNEKTVEQLAAENAILKAKLIANIRALREKKKILKDEKKFKQFENYINMPRRVFAFKVIYPGGFKVDLANEVCFYLKQLFGNVKVIKQFMINEYVYVKIKSNVVLSRFEYACPNNISLIQIDPKLILKYQ